MQIVASGKLSTGVNKVAQAHHEKLVDNMCVLSRMGHRFLHSQATTRTPSEQLATGAVKAGIFLAVVAAIAAVLLYLVIITVDKKNLQPHVTRMNAASNE